METSEPLAVLDYKSCGLDAALEFLKRTRSEMRQLRMVRVYVDKLQVLDVNKDIFEVRGIGYSDAAIVELLDAVNTNYNPETLAATTEAEFKEFLTGRRYPWAQDRVM